MEDKITIVILVVLIGLIHLAMLPPSIENLTEYQRELKAQFEVCQNEQECRSIAKLLKLSGVRDELEVDL